MEQFNTIEQLAGNYVSDQPLSSQFRVASISEGLCNLASYNRRDFYKITLVLHGDSTLLYANRGIEINKPALVFTNPMIPYSWEGNENGAMGYFCVFSSGFLQAGTRMESLQESILFKADGEPIYFLNDAQLEYVNSIFTRMRSEIEGEYVYKYDLIRNQVNLIMHEAIKMQPAAAYFAPQNAASRIAKLFLTLLEKQFPVDSPRFILKLKKAGDYADKLAVHVNHLNAAVQEVTGRSTTTLITDKILGEAKSLLLHSDWSVADIAYSLGFEYASYFNKFFKKHTGATPLVFRKTL